MKKIGLDCRRIYPSYTGGTTAFTVGLIEGLINFSEKKMILFSSIANNSFFNDLCKGSAIEVACLDRKNKFFYLLRESTKKILFRLNLAFVYCYLTNKIYQNETNYIDHVCSVLYIPTDLTSYNQKIKTFVSLHDIQQHHYPHFFTPSQLAERKVTFLLCLKYLSHLQASSIFMKEDFKKYYPFLSYDQIHTISEGVNLKRFKSKLDMGVISKYKLPKKYLYYPGQLWLHKDHITVLKALKTLRDKKGLEVNLVLTGASYGAHDSISEFINTNDLGNQIFMLGPVPSEDLVSIFKGAQFIISSVLYESSSLPIREAAASGVPIIASDIAPNKEIEEIIYINFFNAGNSDSLVKIILDVWENKQLINHQKNNNNSKIKTFSWKKIAKKYIQTLEKIIN